MSWRTSCAKYGARAVKIQGRMLAILKNNALNEHLPRNGASRPIARVSASSKREASREIVRARRYPHVNRQSDAPHRSSSLAAFARRRHRRAAADKDLRFDSWRIVNPWYWSPPTVLYIASCTGFACNGAPRRLFHGQIGRTRKFSTFRGDSRRPPPISTTIGRPYADFAARE